MRMVSLLYVQKVVLPKKGVLGGQKIYFSKVRSSFRRVYFACNFHMNKVCRVLKAILRCHTFKVLIEVLIEQFYYLM